ncbi:MAG: hypothetical protein WC612_05830 [Bdellovibrionales bacterium]|jgi:hypothetical protein
MKNRVLLLSILAFLAACSTPPPRPDPIRLDYAQLGKIMLDAQDIRIIDRSQNTPQWPPYVGHLFQPTLKDAVNRMAADRLQAAGTLGHATLIIKDASVTEQSLNTSSDFESLFTRQQAAKYIGRVEVSLEAQSPADASIGMASAHAIYSVSLPEEPTETEKYEAYRKLLTNLMADLNKELERGIKEHMSRFILNDAAASAASPTRDSALPHFRE